jgi:hypothetical protein
LCADAGESFTKFGFFGLDHVAAPVTLERNPAVHARHHAVRFPLFSLVWFFSRFSRFSRFLFAAFISSPTMMDALARSSRKKLGCAKWAW